MGGPVLNDRGEVVGVVRSRINALYVLDHSGELPERINQAIVSDQVLASFDAFVSASAASQKCDRQEIVARASKATVLIKILSAEKVAAATPQPSQQQPDSPQLTNTHFLTSIDSILTAHNYEALSQYLAEKTYYFGKANATKAWIKNDMDNDQHTYAWCKTAPDLSTYQKWTDANGYIHQAVEEETWAKEHTGRLHHAHCRLGIVRDGSTILEFHFDVLRGHTE